MKGRAASTAVYVCLVGRVASEGVRSMNSRVSAYDMMTW
jgi:hypothetical protein